MQTQINARLRTQWYTLHKNIAKALIKVQFHCNMGGICYYYYIKTIKITISDFHQS